MLNKINSEENQTKSFTENNQITIEESRVFKVKDNKRKDLVLNLSFDTEYRTSKLYDSKQPDVPFLERFGVTSQFKNNNKNESEIILVHQHMADWLEEQGLADKIRHNKAESDFHVVDYLKSEGLEVKLSKISDLHSEVDNENRYKLLKKTPTLTIELWAYFAMVDITMICLGECLEDLNRAFVNKEITLKRRLKASSINGIWVSPWVIHINNSPYRVNIKFFDVYAVLGNASYKEFCISVGIELPDKDLPDNYIERMDEAYLEIPAKYDAYALGDLKSYEAYQNFCHLLEKVYHDLNLYEYYQKPNMTIGSTVEKIIHSIILKIDGTSYEYWKNLPNKKSEKTLAEGIETKESYLEKLTSKASADYLSKQTKNINLLSKCDGGRCWNAKPTLANQEGVLIDIDISGAYSTSMSELRFPFGNPLYISSKKGIKLTKFMNYIGKELVPGLWAFRVNTTQALNYIQDLIPSWYECKSTETRKCDSEGWKITGELDSDSGHTKIFSEQIINGSLTSDLLECIEKEWSTRQRDDFFEKVVVLAAGFYPRSLEATNIEEFHEKIKGHNNATDFNTCLEDAEIINANDCHSWHAFNLGKHLINPIRNNRIKYDKNNPLNGMFKLINNTVYGDSVSKYFKTANMIIGSNITAKVRTVMWYAEKALNLQGSITDGHIFDVNRVLHQTKNGHLNKDKLAILYTYSDRELVKNNICEFRPLFDNPVVKTANGLLIKGIIYTIEESKELIANKALAHIKNLFSNNDLLKSDAFKFEIKKIMKKAAYHGTADYLTIDLDDKIDVKMRSYESKLKGDGTLKKDHSAFELENGELKTDEEYYKRKSPALRIMSEILDNTDSCKLHPNYIKLGMIKPGEYANRYQATYKNSHLSPGDLNMKMGNPQYFSLAQFHFKNLQQYKSWYQINDRLISKYGLSFELFFPGKKEGTVNYQKMLKTLDEMIREDVINPMKRLDPCNHLHRTIPQKIKVNIEAVKKMDEILEKRIKTLGY